MFRKNINMKELTKKITDTKISVDAEKIDFQNYSIRYEFENEKIRLVKNYYIYNINNFGYEIVFKKLMKYKQIFKDAIKEKNRPYFDDIEFMEDNIDEWFK